MQRRVILKGCIGCLGLILVFFLGGAVITFWQSRTIHRKVFTGTSRSERGKGRVVSQEHHKANRNFSPTPHPPESALITPVPSPPKTRVRVPVEYLGEPRTRIFHRLNCPEVQKPGTVVVAFPDRQQAFQNDYAPCKRCRP